MTNENNGSKIKPADLYLTTKRPSSHGLNFNYNDTEPIELLANLKSILKTHHLDQETRRHQTNYCQCPTQQTKEILSQKKRALKTLKQDESIVNLLANKGRPTVVMDKTDYISKTI